MPPFTGTELQLEFLLYRTDQQQTTPYRRLHLRVNVTEPGAPQTALSGATQTPATIIPLSGA